VTHVLLDLFFFRLGVDQDVIEKYHNALVEKRTENIVHQTHQGRRGIGETKG
jgi:hypothetical protein